MILPSPNDKQIRPGRKKSRSSAESRKERKKRSVTDKNPGMVTK